MAVLLAAWVLAASCAGTKVTTPMPVENKFRLALELFEKRKYESAQRMFESVIFDNPGSVVADSAQFLVGACYFNLHEYELAAGEFQRFYQQYPTSPLVDDAELMRARCYLKGAPGNVGLDQNYTQNCVVTLQTFKDDHPTSDLLPAADSLLAVCWARLSKKDFDTGKLYQRLKLHRAAGIYYQLVLDRFPESPLVPEAIYRMGETFRGMGINDTAIVWYEKLVYLYPDDPTTTKARKRIAKLQPLLPEASADSPGDTL